MMTAESMLLKRPVLRFIVALLFLLDMLFVAVGCVNYINAVMSR